MRHRGSPTPRSPWPNRAVWFYGAARGALPLGLVGLSAASAGRERRTGWVEWWQRRTHRNGASHDCGATAGPDPGGDPRFRMSEPPPNRAQALHTV